MESVTTVFERHEVISFILFTPHEDKRRFDFHIPTQVPLLSRPCAGPCGKPYLLSRRGLLFLNRGCASPSIHNDQDSEALFLSNRGSQHHEGLRVDYSSIVYV